MSTPERINITFYDNHGYCGYKVSKPSWDGGEVVMASDYDALAARVVELEEALLTTLNHAKVFNRDTDSVWLAVKKVAESALRGEKK